VADILNEVEDDTERAGLIEAFGRAKTVYMLRLQASDSLSEHQASEWRSEYIRELEVRGLDPSLAQELDVIESPIAAASAVRAISDGTILCCEIDEIEDAIARLIYDVNTGRPRFPSSWTDVELERAKCTREVAETYHAAEILQGLANAGYPMPSLLVKPTLPIAATSLSCSTRSRAAARGRGPRARRSRRISRAGPDRPRSTDDPDLDPPARRPEMAT
jgi:hypothetical protein